MRVIVHSVCIASILQPLPAWSRWSGSPAPNQALGDRETAAQNSPPTTEPTSTDATLEKPSQPAASAGDEARPKAPEVSEERAAAFTEHFSAGKQRFKAGDYVGAAHAFDQAFAALPLALALYNVELSYEGGGDFVAAANTAKRYLALPPCTGESIHELGCADRHSDVEKTLQKLLRKLVTIRLNVDDKVILRQIRINGLVSELAEFPVFVVPGTIEIELIGQNPAAVRTRRVELPPGSVFTLDVLPFAAARNDVAATPSTPSDAPTPRPPRKRTGVVPAFWATSAMTMGSAVTMSVLGALTLDARRRFNAQRCDPIVDPPQSCSYPSHEESRVTTLRTGTNVMIGITAAFALISTGLGIAALRQRAAKRRQAHRPTPAHLQIGPGTLVLSY